MEAQRIRIPERYQPGIAKLVSLSDNALEELLSVLNETPSSLNLDTIKANTLSKISSTPESDVDEIISALDSLYYIRHESDITIQDFSEQVLQAMRDTNNRELQLEENIRGQFKERLTKLLSGALLDIAIKSRDVLYEQERLFGSARTLTDIRLVSGGNVEDYPRAAVIVYMLKIHYIQNNEHKEFFVALDGRDIDLLINELIQSQEKAETLKSTLAAANVPYIDVE
jgi:hypothetical protein